MISKRVKSRKDGKSSALDAMRYGAGVVVDKETGELLEKSHRARFGNFGILDNGVFEDIGVAEMSNLIELAAIETQANCDLNTRVDAKKKMAHFVVSFNQEKPSEAVLRDTEDSMLAAMDLDKNHFATFLHNDNGYWHLHIFASCIEKDGAHKCNSLWHDKINRDKVCREIEIRHGLQRDNGLHEVDNDGKIVEIPLAERRAAREAKSESNPSISDRAKTTELYSGEKSFQTWANEIRIGDRLKHAKSWKDLHAAAAAYNCEIKLKGAGFVVCPVGEKGGIQLSKVGLKNLPSKFGAFQVASDFSQAESEVVYKPTPTQAKATSHYNKWRVARDIFKPVKTIKINEQRDAHKILRKTVCAQQKAELVKIRGAASGQSRVAAVSIAKMQHTVALAALTEQFAHDRSELRKRLASAGPAHTFRDYLMAEAAKGDNVALGLVRKYGIDASTDVLRKREADQLMIVATVRGQEYRPASRLKFTHSVDRNGTVVYDFGKGRKVTDSAVSKQVQLNAAAANSPDAIATALTFATTKFGNTLTLAGSPEFQRLAVETAVSKRLGLKFADPSLEAYRQKLTIEQQKIYSHQSVSIVPDLTYLPPDKLSKGVADVLARSPHHGRPPNHIIHAYEYSTGNEAEGSGSLHELPVRGVDGHGQDDPMSLPNAVPGGVGDDEAGQDSNLRRTGASTPSSRNRKARGVLVNDLLPVVDPAPSTQSREAGPLPSDTDQLIPLPTQRNAMDVYDESVLKKVDRNTHLRFFKANTPGSQYTVQQIKNLGVTDKRLKPDDRERRTELLKTPDRAAAVQAFNAAAEKIKSYEPGYKSDAAKAEAHLVTPPAPEPAPPTAHEWLANWSAETGKSVASPKSENGQTAHTVIHVAQDGIVLDKGRSGAVYVVPKGIPLAVGDKVVVDRNAELRLPQVPEQGDERNKKGR